VSSVRVSPGPAADRAFRLGIAAAAAVAVGGVALAAWVGAIGPLAAGVFLVVLFPVYLLVAAAALSVWLGYDRGAASLRRVAVERSTGEDAESRSGD